MVLASHADSSTSDCQAEHPYAMSAALLIEYEISVRRIDRPVLFTNFEKLWLCPVSSNYLQTVAQLTYFPTRFLRFPSKDRNQVSTVQVNPCRRHTTFVIYFLQYILEFKKNQFLSLKSRAWCAFLERARCTVHPTVQLMCHIIFDFCLGFTRLGLQNYN